MIVTLTSRPMRINCCALKAGFAVTCNDVCYSVFITEPEQMLNLRGTHKDLSQVRNHCLLYDDQCRFCQFHAV